MLEVLCFLLTTQDLGTGMFPKGACQPWMAYQAPVRPAAITQAQKA